MNYLVRLLMMVGVLSLTMNPPIAGAEETNKKNGAKGSNVELNEVEITASLEDVLVNLKLKETEIMGSIESPVRPYIKRWADPNPFPLGEDELARELIEPLYEPMDRETLNKEFAFLTGNEIPNSIQSEVPGISDEGIQISGDFNRDLSTFSLLLQD